MSSLALGIALLVLAGFVALYLASRSARGFMQEKRKRHHGPRPVRLSKTAPRGHRTRKP
jgi:hypothetical protein